MDSHESVIMCYLLCLPKIMFVVTLFFVISFHCGRSSINRPGQFSQPDDQTTVYGVQNRIQSANDKFSLKLHHIHMHGY